MLEDASIKSKKSKKEKKQKRENLDSLEESFAEAQTLQGLDDQDPAETKKAKKDKKKKRDSMLEEEYLVESADAAIEAACTDKADRLDSEEVKQKKKKKKEKKEKRDSEYEVVEEVAETPKAKKSKHEVGNDESEANSKNVPISTPMASEEYDENTGGAKYWRRLDVEKYQNVVAGTKYADNSHYAKGGDSWGNDAADRLGQVRGKGFKKEMQKLKRASWKGCGSIDTGVNSVQFSDWED